MHLFLADINDSALKDAVERVKGVEGVGQVESMKVDVGDVKQVEAFRERVLDDFGEVRHTTRTLDYPFHLCRSAGPNRR